QPRILDSDDRLGGEIREQLDLLLNERSNFLTKDDDDSNRLAVFEHRNCNDAANATELYCSDALRMALGVGARRGEIGHLSGPLSPDCLAHWPTRNRAERTALSYLDERRGDVMRAAYPKSVTLAEIEQPELGPAQPYRIIQQGGEHGLQLSRRG